jgi:hypothetical protein
MEDKKRQKSRLTLRSTDTVGGTEMVDQGCNLDELMDRLDLLVIAGELGDGEEQLRRHYLNLCNDKDVDGRDEENEATVER